MRLELFAVPRRHDRIEQRGEKLVGQRRYSRLERDDLSVLADERRHADAQMEVGRSHGALGVEQALDGHRLVDDGCAHAASTSISSRTYRKFTISSASDVST